MKPFFLQERSYDSLFLSKRNAFVEGVAVGIWLVHGLQWLMKVFS